MSASRSATRTVPRSTAIYACGELKAEGSSVAEGIGQGGSPAISRARRSTRSSASPTRRGWKWVERLLKEEGLCLGLSSGINVAGAVRLARELGPGKRVATTLCDTGFRYLSTLYNAEWPRGQGIAGPGVARSGSERPILATGQFGVTFMQQI